MVSGNRVFPIALALAAGLAATSSSFGQVKGSPWQILPEIPASTAAEEPWIRPAKCAPAILDIQAITALLKTAPSEDANYRPPANPLIISLPMPDGSFARFKVWESSIMEAPLAAQFPEIRTFGGQGIDDPAACIRFDLTPQGFHSQILSPQGDCYIDPYSRNNTSLYAVYYKHDYTKKNDGWTCGVTETYTHPRNPNGGTDSPSGATFRTYRLAQACTGEYAAFQGGTVALAQAAIVTAINRVTGVYEIDQSIRLILVANNTNIVFTNAATDPYTNNNPSSLLTQNQTTCDNVANIGAANYDIGHVFSTAGGGLAALGVVGLAGSKAQGETGTSSPVGDPFTIDYVAHEMGHQFGANHTFNSSTSSCGGGNRSAAHAYEPGSGSTIMAYAGICGADDLQPHSDALMTFDSHDAITTYTSSGVGAGNTQTATGNTIPTVNAGASFTIPCRTPFTLTAVGTDPDPGQVLTYIWEQRNLGASITLAAGDNGSSPIMRSWTATTDPTRTIPRLSNLLANTTAPGEILPTTARTLNFRVSVRDNRANGGGYNNADMAVTVVNVGATGFSVTSPNTAVIWSGPQTVTWNVASTNIAPINCANVAILLSTDGGNTFPATLVASTPNTGSAAITLPNISSSTARIKVAAVGNIFFDVSNTNFTITPVPPPSNNNCANAITIGVGSTPFTTVSATTDGPAEPGCNFPVSSDPQINQDVWYRFVAPCTGQVSASLCGSNYDTKIAIYNGLCPVTGSAIACNDDSSTCGAGSVQSYVTFNAVQGQTYTIRVGGYLTNTGTGTLTLACAPCYSNCDGSTTAPILTANDFQCFLNAFAANDTYANCDGSTTVPVLTANDFQCFLNAFAAGCT